MITNIPTKNTKVCNFNRYYLVIVHTCINSIHKIVLKEKIKIYFLFFFLICDILNDIF